MVVVVGIVAVAVFVEGDIEEVVLMVAVVDLNWVVALVGGGW